MGLLTADEKQTLTTLLLQLPNKSEGVRSVLLGALPFALRNSIPADPSPDLHLRLMVDALNNWPPLTTGEQPLLLLIEAAADQVKDTHLAAAFRQLGHQVQARLAPLPQNAPSDSA